MITVYIPSIYSNKLARMIDDFSNQTISPEKIIVVDNRPLELVDHKVHLRSNYPLLEIIPKDPEMSVNEVWNYGLQNCPEGHHLCLASDDMRLESGFFEKATKILDKKDKAGVVCPHLAVLEKEVDMNQQPPSGFDTATIRVRGKGNAGIFVIREDIITQLPLIPTEAGIHTFLGDNWLGSNLMDLGFTWERLINSLAYHGPRVRSKTIQQKLKAEKRIYSQFQKGEK